MSKIEDKYDKLAVKINSNGINGSGCIIQPTYSDYSYIFTAKHCLTEDGQVDNDKIEISGSNGIDAGSFKIQDIFLDDELDVAIIKIARLNNIETSLFIKPEKELSTYLYGYPKLLQGKSQILSCKISFDRDNYSDIELSQSQVTFEKNSPDTLRGFSGSGIFHEKSGKVCVVGILTRLKAPDGAYNNVCAYHISNFDNLIKSKGFPSLFEDYIDEIISDYSFSFTNYNLELEKHYLQRDIDEQTKKLFLSPKNIWISGVPGVGKTLLINRNLRIDKRDYISIDLTTSKLDDIDEYFKIINNEIVYQKKIGNVSDLGNIYDKIASNLKQIVDHEELFLFVDEVPIRDTTIFSQFLSGFIKISEKYSNTSNRQNQIKWIISTRIDPSEFVKNLNDCLVNGQKASKHFLFKPMDLWTPVELNSLIELLEKNLNFHFSGDTRKTIINMCNGIPNPIKRVIELILIDNCDIEEAIITAKTEYF